MRLFKACVQIQGLRSNEALQGLCQSRLRSRKLFGWQRRKKQRPLDVEQTGGKIFYIMGSINGGSSPERLPVEFSNSSSHSSGKVISSKDHVCL